MKTETERESELQARIDLLIRQRGKLHTALRELLEYTGGSDLVEKQPDHPIAKAFRALGRNA